jgi:hypothetical protein
MAAMLLLLLVGADSGTNDSERTVGSVTIPGCGVAAAYGFLQLHGVDAAVSDVTSRFLRLRADVDLDRLSLADVRQVLQSYELRVVSVRADSRDPTALPLPAILYLRPERLRRETDAGHLVLARSADRAAADIVDLTSAEGPFRVPLDALCDTWDGEGIIIASGRSSVGHGWIVAAIAGALLAVVGAGRAFRRARWKRLPGGGLGGCLPGVAAILLLGASGCGTREPPVAEEDPLRFEKIACDLGAVKSGAAARCRMRFQVWPTSVVRISQVESSCPCLTSVPDILDRELAPGSTHELELVFEPRELGGPVRGSVVVKTEPPSGRPPVLSVQAVVDHQPAAINDIPVLGAPDELVSVQIPVAHFRSDRDAPLQLDRQRSDLGDFAVVDEARSSKPSRRGGNDAPAMVFDRVILTAKARKPLEPGRRVVDFQLAWQGREERSRVPVVVLVEHPFRLRVDRLFLGEVEPGESREVKVEAATRAAAAVAVREVRCEPASWTAKWSKAEGVLTVTVQAPRSAGRFEGYVLLLFDRRLPEVRLTISGIVNGARAKAG